jgi:hypothetical protein
MRSMSLANRLQPPVLRLAFVGAAAPLTQPLGSPPRTFPLSRKGCYMAAALARGDRCDA